jgi:glycosyltransferase involved in cell wall biosynthesis
MPAVSVVIIFLDAARWLDEAVASVVAQDDPDWELVLVDDGSTDGSTAIADAWAARDPRIRRIAHAGHANLGMSASRNAGVRASTAPLVAFLDADDRWAPDKLRTQRALFDADPALGYAYGASVCWYSWDPTATTADYRQALGHEAGARFDPPALVTHYLTHSSGTPCTCELMMRRSAWEAVGGSDATFRGMYEDQVLALKLALTARAAISDGGKSFYRHHPASHVTQSLERGTHAAARRAFLAWAEGHLRARGVTDAATWRALRAEQLRLAPPGPLRRLATRLARLVVPPALRGWLRERELATRAARAARDDA